MLGSVRFLVYTPTIHFVFPLLIDDHLYSAILRSLEQTHCARLWFYMGDKLFIARFLNVHRSGVLKHRLGASSVYTIQPCSLSLHAKPLISGVCVFSCNLPPALLAE